ncbi:MAG: hypothetical protein AB1428_10705 [Bacteroidota bacterium]
MGVLQNFQLRSRRLCFVMACLMLLPVIPLRTRAQGEEPTTKNVSFRVTGQVVEIYYDLIAPAEQVYNVTVILKRRFEKTYSYVPVATSGDVGPAVIPGENRRITWKLTDEFPNGLPGEDCFFVIEAQPGAPVSGGISSIVWIVGGAAVLGGVLTAVLLSSKGNGGGGPPVIPPSDFPNPPGRP